MFSSLSWIYGQIADLRNAFYDKGVFESLDLGARTISIGNITTGGTGKTPLVAYVAELLAERGERVCILTRGYGRKNPKDRVLVSDGNEILADPAQSGDEPFELAQKLIGKAIVLADADRTSAGEWAMRKFGISAFVLDDGFQHRKVVRDLDIVCIDATDPFGGGKVLPAGRLREPIANLRRADVIVITRADVADNIADLRSEISDLNSNAPIFVAKNKIIRISELTDFNAANRHSIGRGNINSAETPDDALDRRPALAFCGIGNPEYFFSSLKKHGVDLTASESFGDHHIYDRHDIQRIELSAKSAGAEILITTAKDAVKLRDLSFGMPCFVVEIEIDLDDADAFARLI